MLQKALLIFRKRYFLIFRERYIQNLSIVRILLYSKSETYSQHCQTSTMEIFAKNSYLAHFPDSGPTQKKFIENLLQKKFLYFFKRKLFLYSQKWNPPLSSLSTQNFSIKNLLRKSFLYFPKKPLFFWKRKSKKDPYIVGNGTFFSGSNFQRPKIFYTLSSKDTKLCKLKHSL